jgi:hypothetical protein
VSLLLLPRLGVGNTIAFNNNFTVSKDGNPWSDGGADTFDSTTGVQVTAANDWMIVGGSAYTAPDGVIQSSHALGNGAVDIGVYAGWASSGIFVCEIELGYQPLDALNLRFACNTGYDNGSPTGIATKAFAIGSNVYELKTVWTTYGQKDSWKITNETQLTVTVVPYLASQNVAGANPYSWSGSGDDRDYRLNNVQRGATMYIQWGKVDIDAVQNWIIADLVESEEFENSPHARLLLSRTPPGTRLANLFRMNGPASHLWNRPGGYDRNFHAMQPGRKDIHFSGRGVIAGTVKEKGLPDQPLVRRVQLISENANVLVAETWSDTAGNYRFEFIDAAQRYTVVSYDYKHLYRAVIADNLKPEPMP